MNPRKRSEIRAERIGQSIGQIDNIQKAVELAAGATDEDLDRDGTRGIATRLDDIEDTQQEILDRLERLEE